MCKIAGLVYEIEYEYEGLERHFEDYLIDECLDEKVYHITYSKDDYEQVRADNYNTNSSYIEFICIMQNIIRQLPKDRLVMHGAVIEYKGKAYLFTAPSGTGKTTHISMWMKCLGDKARIINGDKPVLAVSEDEVTAFGAPWCGKEGWQINTSAPLEGICLLERGEENLIEEINPGKYIEYFVKELYIGNSENTLLDVIDIFEKISRSVLFYRMECNISEEAARCSFEKMTGDKWLDEI